MSKSKYDPNDYVRIAGGCIGHNSRATSFMFDKHQAIEFDFIINDLKKLFTKIYPNWDTINIEIEAKKMIIEEVKE